MNLDKNKYYRSDFYFNKDESVFEFEFFHNLRQYKYQAENKFKLKLNMDYSFNSYEKLNSFDEHEINLTEILNSVVKRLEKSQNFPHLMLNLASLASSHDLHLVLPEEIYEEFFEDKQHDNPIRYPMELSLVTEVIEREGEYYVSDGRDEVRWVSDYGDIECVISDLEDGKSIPGYILSNYGQDHDNIFVYPYNNIEDVLGGSWNNLYHIAGDEKKFLNWFFHQINLANLDLTKLNNTRALVTNDSDSYWFSVSLEKYIYGIMVVDNPVINNTFPLEHINAEHIYDDDITEYVNFWLEWTNQIVDYYPNESKWYLSEIVGY